MRALAAFVRDLAPPQPYDGIPVYGPCGGCFGRGVRPFGRHSTMEGCPVCRGTGAHPPLCDDCIHAPCVCDDALRLSQ